jgi:putative transposase
MPNHVHLIIEPRLAKEMSKAIGGINLCYTAWFNKKYNKVGHCWQDRFKSFIIEKNRYLISCINYVELNPVRANLVENPIDYLWSSYKTRLNGHEDKTLDKLELI